MLVEDLREKITYREFLEWLTFLSKEEERQTKQDYYLAQIAAEVRRGHVKNPRTVKVQDFLIELKDPASKAPEGKSKAVWLKALNIKKKES